jgi:threonine dehydrogenase-like Zn-dependent dehydrogenase
VSDDQAIMRSDIYPTAWFGAQLAKVSDGDTVGVLGCGPVGLFAILSAFQQGAGSVLAVDTVPSRLDAARRLGAEVIDFNAEDPTEVIQELTGGIGVDRMIDAVGTDAEPPSSGPAAEQGGERSQEIGQISAEEAQPRGEWGTGSAPSQALEWAVAGVAKAGTIGIIGVYPPPLTAFPIGRAFNRNLTIQAGNCNHRRYIPHLLSMVRSGAVDP